MAKIGCLLKNLPFTKTKLLVEIAVLSSSLATKAVDDFELVQSAIEGNQLAYSSLMNRYHHSVYHQMLKMVKSRDDANDLTLEAFGKAFHKLPSYAPNFAFSTWLFRIAINNCIDHIRKKRIHALSLDEPMNASTDSDFSHSIHANIRNPEEEIIRNQKIELIRLLLQKLGAKYQTMIQLRYYDELSYEEIATELSMPLGTVKAQLYRAKESLYTLLQKPGASAYLETTKRRGR